MSKIINGIKCRTREESLKHVVAQAKAGKIGPKDDVDGGSDSCQYQYPSGNNCAVGCLFSAKQLEDIKAKSINGMSISYLATHVCIGKKNVEAVTGMSLDELKRLQHIHDRSVGSEGTGVQTAREALIYYCQNELKALKNKKASV